MKNNSEKPFNTALHPFNIALHWRQELLAEKKLFCNCQVSHCNKQEWASNLRFFHKDEHFQNIFNIDSSISDFVPIRYFFLPDFICLYELGEAHPTTIENALLKKAIHITNYFNCIIPQYTYIMRKVAPLGNTPNGFQKTLLIGQNGTLNLEKNKKIKIETISLIEDTPQYLSQKTVFYQEKSYNLSRYGLPMLDIKTDHSLHTAKEVKEAASKIHDILQGSGLIRRDSHSTRIALEFSLGENKSKIVSIPSINHIVRIITFELKRLKSSDKTSFNRDTFSDFIELRKANKDGTSTYIDNIKAQPLKIEKWCDPINLKKIELQKNLNQKKYLGWQWRKIWETYNYPQDMIEGLLQFGKIDLFEKMRLISPKISAIVWGEILFRWSKYLKRKGVPISNISEERYLSIASFHAMHRCERESLIELLTLSAYSPELSVRDILQEKMNIRFVKKKDLRKQVISILQTTPPQKINWLARERYWMGKLMKSLKGSIKGSILREELYRYFSEYPPTPYDKCSFPPPQKKKKRKF